jgi:BirA family transcriptional regulator, biotin operon repressor / biotin---[acetyl-CoA-carboxylase] ligase
VNYELSWFLRRHGEAFHTPAELAAIAGCDADHVGRLLTELTDAGFRLDHHPTRGIRLAEAPGAYDRDEIAYPRRECLIGHTVRVYDSTSSTNDVAAHLAATGPQSDGIVVLAEEQSTGRGRQGAAWFGARGASLLASVVHWMKPEADTVAMLTLAAGVAVAETAVRVTGVHVGIKWPNDVEIGRRKVAGVLVERPGANGVGVGGRDDGKNAFIVGIGMNVGQPPEGFPPEIAERATSLEVAAGRPVDRILVLEELLTALERQLTDLEGAALEKVRDRYMSHCDMIGRQVTVREDSETFCGEITSISPHYALIVRLDGGTYRSFEAPRVHLI